MADSGGESSSSSSSSDNLLVRKQRLLGVTVKKQTVHALDAICDRCNALLDNGAVILACTGACFRKFHIACYPNEIQSSSWQCVECRTNSHPCFVCQDAGSGTNQTDESIVPCRAAGCGKFYHVSCVTRLPLTRVLEGNAAFICPLHTCHQCEGQSSGATDQAIRCTRCPRAYHATCFPPSGFERFCSTRGLCHAHLGAAPRPSTSSSVDDDDKRSKKEHKKDKRDKKKKKKKDKKQKKDKKTASVDESGGAPEPTAPASSALDSLLNPTPPVHPSVASMPSLLSGPSPYSQGLAAPSAPLLPSPLAASSPPMPLFRPLQERAKAAVGLLKPPAAAIEVVPASVEAFPPPPPPPALAPPPDQPAPPPLNITIPTAAPAPVPDSDDAKALSARNKKKKKRKRVRAVVLTPTEEDAKWVQCDRCKKWRTVPEELDLSAMSNTAWYCSMNDWDVRYASCSVPEEVVEPKVKKAKLDDDNDDPDDAPPASPKGSGTAVAVPTQNSVPPQPSVASMPASSSASIKSEPEKKEAKLTKKQRAKLKSTQQRGQKVDVAPGAIAGAVSSPGAKEIEWVQCDIKSCGKWRVVPPSVDISSLPIKWYCSLNTWAPALANCSVENPSDVESLWQSKSVKPSPPPAKQSATANRQSKGSPRNQGVQLQSALPTVLDVAVALPSAAADSNSSGHVDSPLGKAKKGAKAPELIPVLEWAQCEKCNKWRKLPAHVKSANLPDKWFCSMNHWNPAVASCSVPEETDQEPVPARAPMPIGPRPKRGKLSYRELLYAGNGHLRKAFTEESSTLSFEFEGKLYHRDDQYRKSSMYLAPSASGPPKATVPMSPTEGSQDAADNMDSADDGAVLSQPEEDQLKYHLHAILKADTDNDKGGKSVLDLVAALHSDRSVVSPQSPPVIYSYATVDRVVQAMVASGDMEAFRDERLVTVTVPMQISSYASAYYVAGENNHENRTWKERHTSPHMLYRRKIQYKKPLKMSKPWKQEGFAGWGT